MSECDPSDGDDDSRWTAPATDVELTVGPVPDAIDRSWGRASYSAWISTTTEASQLESGRDPEPEPLETNVDGETTWSDTGPLADFTGPRAR